MINDLVPEGNSLFPAYGSPPPTQFVWRCIVLSMARFPCLVRSCVEVSVEPVKMANRSPKPLGDFVRRIRNEKGLSCSGVSKESARFGKRISASYVNRIENNHIKDPSPDRLKALARGLGIPAEELFARAVGLVAPGSSSEELHLVTRFRELSPDLKAIVLSIVDMFHSQQSRRPRPRSA